MKCAKLEDDYAIYESEGMHFLEKYTFKRQLSLNKQIEWELVEYEKIHLDSQKVQIHISSLLSFDKMYKYYDISLYGILSRRILINNNSEVLYDYIIDSVLNGISPTIYVSYGGVHPINYKCLIPGKNLIDYLQQEHTFINDKNKKDVFDNKWLKNEFLLSYLDAEKVFKMEEKLYFPSSKKLELRK